MFHWSSLKGGMTSQIFKGNFASDLPLGHCMANGAYFLVRNLQIVTISNFLKNKCSYCWSLKRCTTGMIYYMPVVFQCMTTSGFLFFATNLYHFKFLNKYSYCSITKRAAQLAWLREIYKILICVLHTLYLPFSRLYHFPLLLITGEWFIRTSNTNRVIKGVKSPTTLSRFLQVRVIYNWTWLFIMTPVIGTLQSLTLLKYLQYLDVESNELYLTAGSVRESTRFCQKSRIWNWLDSQTAGI